MVLGTAKLRHIKSTLWPTTSERCLKRNYEEIHDRFLPDQVHRESQLKFGWTEEKCIEMESWHRRITPTVYPERNSRDVKDNGISY